MIFYETFQQHIEIQVDSNSSSKINSDSPVLTTKLVESCLFEEDDYLEEVIRIEFPTNQVPKFPVYH